MQKSTFSSYFSTGIPFLLTIAVGLATLKVLNESRFDWKITRNVQHTKRMKHEDLNEESQSLFNSDFKPLSLTEAISLTSDDLHVKADYEMIPMQSSTHRPIFRETKVNK